MGILLAFRSALDDGHLVAIGVDMLGTVLAARTRLVIRATMDYEFFRAAWEEARHAVRLQTIGSAPRETLDLRNLDRGYEVYVEPLGGQDAPPFHVTAQLSWRWTNLNTIRGQLCDEDVLAEMVGRDQAAGLVSEKPAVRVDIELRARAPYDEPLPMPPQPTWQRWFRETVERLQSSERLLPDEMTRENAAGRLEVLAWQGNPKVTAVCTPTGELALEAVTIAAMQIIELPRLLDCPGEPDEGPHDMLRELFARVRASLSAWMQAVEHLRG